MNNLLRHNKLLAFFKLVRIENLVMIALTQIVLRTLIVQKIFLINNIQPELENSLFYCLVLSTVLIAAAGYIINDYFDVKTDLINHPDTVVVDRVIKRRWAIILHITFTLVGITLGMYTALKTGYLRLAIFHFAAAILLWFYSTHLKKTLLIGNVVVSLLTASVTFMPLVYELGVMQKHDPTFLLTYKYVNFSIFKITFIYALFAFITSMAREIIKDMEDYKGDKETGGRTMPIVWGMRVSKLNAFFLLIITILLLLFVLYNTIRSERVLFTLNNFYILMGLVIPLSILALYTIKAQESKQFKKASLLLKFIMLTGLCYSFIFYYN
ncbi:ubiquinone biosynthesis protein UbiA [Sphingobacteriaceae bacterium]|nr:ubiquinone biosynthesis protein UbiA [Sphingobacteriaceae bacterium]